MFSNRKLWEGLQLGAIAGMFITAAVRWSSVPDRIPIHWNAQGDVDGYGGRFEGLLLMPIIAIAIYALLLFIPRLDPAKANYANFIGPYMAVRVVITAYLTFLYVVFNIAIENEASLQVESFIVGGIAIMFIVIGALMGKFRPNYFVGIRTPWTLTSKKAWVKTHRLGGWVFILAGAATGIAAIFSGLVAIFVMMGTLFPGIALVTYYSYRVWKSDPERIPAQDTRPGPNGAAT